MGDVSLGEISHGSLHVVGSPVSINSIKHVLDNGNNVRVDDVVVNFGEGMVWDVQKPSRLPDEHFRAIFVVLLKLEEALECFASLKSMLFSGLLWVNDLNEGLAGIGGPDVAESGGVGEGDSHPGSSPQAHLKHGCFLLKRSGVIVNWRGFKELDEVVHKGIIHEAAQCDGKHSKAPFKGAALNVPS